MKKHMILAVCSLFILNTSLRAQTTTEEIFKKYRFGLYIGPTFNSMRPTASTADKYTVEKTGGHVGFSFGLNGELNINDRYTVFSGIGMDWRGGKIDVQLPAATPAADNYLRGADVKYKLQYLTVPIGLKMTAVEMDKLKIQALTSFDAGLLLSQKGNYTLTSSVYDTVTNKYVTISKENEKLKGEATAVPFTLGWSIGVGAEYDLNGKNAVFVNVLYRNGFVDVTSPKSNDKGLRFSDGNIRSNTFALRIGYYF
ncbi:MAG: outer membrane beta-barrel protein [Chitinophagaceae bacterium]